MPLRRRLALVAAAAVAISILLVALVSYLVVRGELRGQVDDALSAQAEAIQHGDFHELREPIPGIPPSAGGPAQYVQIVGSNGAPVTRQGDVVLPVDTHVASVASGSAGAYRSDVHVGGNHLRQFTFPISVSVDGQVQSAAVQLGRPLNGVDRVLSRLQLILVLLCLGGIALAAALGRLAARRVIAPLADVARTAQHIGETEDLASRITVRADDEVGQLARRFNTMLERLEGSRAELDQSVRAQRQLVADASHELRTPVTSLRTNIEVLLDGGEQSEEDRRRLLDDVVEQSEELSALVADLIELARGEEPVGATTEARLDRIAEEAVAKARRDFPSVRFEASIDPATVTGVPERIARAISNLLDNAARHSTADGLVEVKVDRKGVTVRDHGSGIPDEDLPYVFDRFFRGTNSRSRQGSGLGLAIVRQVAGQHGGAVSAANAPDGGAVLTLELPGVAVQEASHEVSPPPVPTG